MLHKNKIDGGTVIYRDNLFWTIIVSICGALIGAILIYTAQNLHFYQFFMPEMVYIACTGHIGHPGRLFGPLLEFLSDRNSFFDCANLPPDMTAGAIGIFSKTHLYLMLSVAWIWRVLSPSYESLWPMGALFYGAYAGGLFSLLRQFFERNAALVGSAILGLSPIAIDMLPSLRDFSKAPFIVWSLVLLISATRSGNLKRQVILATLAGIVAGVGYGFRTDLAIVAPIAAILLLVGIGPRQYINRAAAIVAFLLCFSISGWPVLSIGNTSALGAMTLEGASDPFNRYLDLASASYSWGARYSDELTLSSIAADMRVQMPDWADGEGAPAFGTSQAITRSTSYLSARLDLFVGDLATKSLKVASLILGYPSAFTPSRLAQDPGRSGIAPSLLSLPYLIIGKIWILPLGILGFGAFLFRESALRPRQTIALTLSFGILLGYTALQFSIRHAFHLEFFWVLGALALFFAIKDAKILAPAVPRFVAALTATAVVITAIYASLLAVQDNAMKSAIKDLLDGQREAVAAIVMSDNTTTTFEAPVPTVYRELVDGRPDSMVGKSLPISQQWETTASVDRLVVSLGGPDCSAETIPISINYAKRDVWQPFDEVRIVRIAPQSGPVSLIFPAFYRATQNFESFSVPVVNATCVLSIERLLAPTRLPSIITLTLPQDWQAHSMHLSLF